MRRFVGILGAAALLWSGLSHQPVCAQGIYRPRRPTISPWLNLAGPSYSPVGTYLGDVRPRMEMERALSQQAIMLQQHRTEVRTLGEQVSTLEQRGRAAPTGTGATFMNYSHYFPSRAAGAAVRRPSWSPQPARSSIYAGRYYY